MPITNLNVKPFFDDFDDNKNFVQVLFRPGYTVQTRELNTLQSILKGQIEKFGNHFFKDGSNVLEGGVNVGIVDVLNVTDFDLLTELTFNLNDEVGNQSTVSNPTTTTQDIKALEGLIITGKETGIKAKVLKIVDNSTSQGISEDPIRIVVSYLESGQIVKSLGDRIPELVTTGVEIEGINYVIGSEISRFLFSEQIEASIEDNINEINRPYAAVFSSMAKGAMGYSLPGTYYVSGNFVNVERQSLLLAVSPEISEGQPRDPREFDPEVNFRIGFSIVTSIIDSSDDSSLLDNAEGVNSFGTPGANRLKIELILDKKDLDTLNTENDERIDDEDQNFIELVRYIENELAQDVSNEAQYSKFIDLLARRTFDESGNYALNPFQLETEEEARDPNDYTVTLGPSKAYVQGFEIEKLAETKIEVERPRTFKKKENFPTRLEIGPTLQIEQPTGQINFGENRALGLQNETGDQDIGFARLASLNTTPNVFSNFPTALGEITPFTKIAVSDFSDFEVGGLVVGPQGQGILAKKPDELPDGTADGVFPSGETNILNLTNVFGKFQETQEITQVKLDGTKATSTILTVTIPKFEDVERLNILDPSGGIDVSALPAPQGNRVIDVAPNVFNGSPANLIYDTGRIIKDQAGDANAFSFYKKVGANNYYALETQVDRIPTKKQYKNNVITLDSIEEGSGKIKVFEVKQTEVANTGSVIDANGAIGSGTGFEILIQWSFETKEYTILSILNSGSGFYPENEFTIAPIVLAVNGGDANGELKIELAPSFTPNSVITQNDLDNAIITFPDNSSGSQNDNATASKTTLSNYYGFRADDKEICLMPDLNKVFVVLESTEDGLPPKGDILRLTEDQTEERGFQIGYEIKGTLSGAKAIVYRSNSTESDRNNLGPLASNNNGGILSGIDENSPDEYKFKESTSNVDIVEVVKITENILFEKGEQITQTYLDENENEITISRNLLNDDSYFEATTSNDITSKFTVDTGQRRTIVDCGKLIYKENIQRARNKIGILFSHYATTNIGLFANSTSYPFYDIKANYIESYDPSDFEKEYEINDLRNYIDFRKIREFVHGNYVNALQSSPAALYESNPFMFLNKEFFEETVFPADNTQFRADTEVYLGRIDKLFLNKDGEFVNEKGSPVEQMKNAAPPQNLDDSMLLYELELPQYLRDIKAIEVEATENRRYTMKDISAIDQGLTRLEETVALNSLELAALTENILDDDGDERLKQGVFVDPFTDETKADLENPDHNTNIDFDLRRLEPAQIQETINLVEASGNESGQNYSLRNGIVTLNYSTTPMIAQRKASNTIKINPYDAWSWVGTMEITPSRDFWRTRGFTTRYAVVRTNGEVVYTSSPRTFSRWLKPVTTSRTTVRNWRWWTGRRRRRIPRELGLEGRTTTTTTRTEFTSSVRVDNRVTTASRIDKMRGKNIQFNAQLMRPNTKLLAKFNGVDVTRYCRQYVDNNPSGGFKSFNDADPSNPRLKTDFLGRIRGVFALPDKVFQTGRKVFQLTSEPTLKDFTNANATYESSGIHFQTNTLLKATRSSFNSSRTSSQITGRTWRDPIAQSFLMPKNGYIDFVDFYSAIVEGGERLKTVGEVIGFLRNYNLIVPQNLYASGGTVTTSNNIRNEILNDPAKYYSDEIDKDLFTSVEVFANFIANSIKEPISFGPFVSLEIVTNENGYPSQNTVPGSFVKLYPGNRKFGFKNNKLYSSNNGGLTSRAKFDYPIYLSGGTEYSIVLKSPSGRNSVFISVLGERTIDTNSYISSQPYLGSLFTSQNASTWTPEQTKDLKFIIHRCVFSKSGSKFNVVNESGRDYRPLGANENSNAVIETIAGSDIVRIYHENHNMFPSPNVGTNNVNSFNPSLFNLPDDLNNGTLNGIPLEQLENKPLNIINFTNDWYEFKTPAKATVSGTKTIGKKGGNIIGTQVIQFNELNLLANVIKPQGTFLESNLTTKAYGNSVGNTNEKFLEVQAIDAEFVAPDESGFIPPEKVSIPQNEFYELSQPILVNSDSNASSLIVEFDMNTETDWLSPVIDLEDLEILSVRNVLDYQLDSTSLSKYVSNEVTLEFGSTALKYTFDYDISKFSKIGLYYKVIPLGSDLAFDEIDWVKTTQTINGEVLDFEVNDSKSTTANFIQDGIEEFDKFKIMLTLDSFSEAEFPTVEKLRVTALASVPTSTPPII